MKLYVYKYWQGNYRIDEYQGRECNKVYLDQYNRRYQKSKLDIIKDDCMVSLYGDRIESFKEGIVIKLKGRINELNRQIQRLEDEIEQQ